MSITAYQILTPLVCIIAILYAWNLVFRQKKTIWEAILWTLFWGGLSLIALFPNSIDYLTAITGIQDRENAVLITCLGILFFIVFSLVIRLESLEQRQTRVIRKVALKNADLEQSKDAKRG